MGKILQLAIYWEVLATGHLAEIFINCLGGDLKTGHLLGRFDNWPSIGEIWQLAI